MLLAGIVAAVGVLGLTVWIARRISGPVTRLAAAAARLGRGDLDAPVPIETRDEIGVLAQTFEETRAALKARDARAQMMLAGIAHEVRNPLGASSSTLVFCATRWAGNRSGWKRSGASNARWATSRRW